MIIVCYTLISLSRSDTIGQDELEVNTTWTTFTIVFKATQSMKGTIFLQHLFHHCRTWELKHWSITFEAYRLWKPVISFAVDFLHPLGYSFVKESGNPLQLYPLPVFEAKLRDEDKELWPSNLMAKFLWSRGLFMCPIFSHIYLLCSSIKVGRLRRFVHFYS